MSNVLTLSEVQSILTELVTALKTVAQGKEYWMNGQRYVSEDMDIISTQIDKYTRIETQLLRQQAGGTAGFRLARFRT